MKHLASLALALLLCNNVFAGEIDFSFNSDAFRIFYIHDFASKDLQSDFGYLYNRDEGWVANASLYLTGLASDGENPLKAGLGGRTGVVNGDGSNESGVPLAVGGYLQYTFPRMDRLHIRGDAYIAPSILTLSDLDKYQDYSFRVGYNIMREADLYLGWRYVEGRFENGSEVKFDDGFNLGFNIRF
jgi:hypothetical protein